MPTPRQSGITKKEALAIIQRCKARVAASSRRAQGTRFTEFQYSVLQARFAVKPAPKAREQSALSQAIGMTPKQVEDWFKHTSKKASKFKKTKKAVLKILKDAKKEIGRFPNTHLSLKNRAVLCAWFEIHNKISAPEQVELAKELGIRSLSIQYWFNSRRKKIRNGRGVEEAVYDDDDPEEDEDPQDQENQADLEDQEDQDQDEQVQADLEEPEDQDSTDSKADHDDEGRQEENLEEIPEDQEEQDPMEDAEDELEDPEDQEEQDPMEDTEDELEDPEDQEEKDPMEEEDPADLEEPDAQNPMDSEDDESRQAENLHELPEHQEDQEPMEELADSNGQELDFQSLVENVGAEDQKQNLPENQDVVNREMLQNPEDLEEPDAVEDASEDPEDPEEPVVDADAPEGPAPDQAPDFHINQWPEEDQDAQFGRQAPDNEDGMAADRPGRFREGRELPQGLNQHQIDYQNDLFMDF
ncbi:hypothetical protein L3Y34_009903 [Caenorhabditis briggsae]|uniref:Homeobox domain-containing protein n=1 Tax=Caenorhabditis briggsae TaxID=6238 RepID=A0AAE9D2Z1_CAEBR|nr:hypothetical protein L3Y34_009903 [Caenorhabditis briggsae]